MGERRHLEQASLPATAETARSGSPSLDGFEEELALPGDEGLLGAGATLYAAVGVRFAASHLVEHDGGDVSYARGDHVVCELPQGVAWGEVVVPTRRVLLEDAPPRILRRATKGDAAAEAHLREREQEVWRVAKDAARAIKLPVKVVRAEAIQGGGKVVVYFASDAKVAFREWLRGIGRASRERIELRQIGMRDAAKVIGGIGPCGLQLCCNTFLSDFTPVGIKMAKVQGLTLNPQKVSGICGRLLCCLVYEEAQYRAGRALLPEPGDQVVTPEGRGQVREVDVLQQRVVVRLENGESRGFAVADVTRRSVE